VLQNGLLKENTLNNIATDIEHIILFNVSA